MVREEVNAWGQLLKISESQRNPSIALWELSRFPLPLRGIFFTSLELVTENKSSGSPVQCWRDPDPCSASSILLLDSIPNTNIPKVTRAQRGCGDHSPGCRCDCGTPLSLPTYKMGIILVHSYDYRQHLIQWKWFISDIIII